MPKGFCTACVAVLFDTPPTLDAVVAALAGRAIARRVDKFEAPWQMTGPAVFLPFRPEVNGQVSVDVVSRPWPDSGGGPEAEKALADAWMMGQFGPFAHPRGLELAMDQSRVWPEGKSVPARHKGFVRVRSSYLYGAADGAAPVPADYDPVAELQYVTDVAAALLSVPGATCYFNPNGEVLLDAAALTDTLTYAKKLGLPPLEAWSNVRLDRIGKDWVTLDTVGNAQLDLPDVEALVPASNPTLVQEVDPFLRDLTQHMIDKGIVFKDGDTIEGPGGKWRTLMRKSGMMLPPRPALRLYPDGSQPPPFLVSAQGQDLTGGLDLSALPVSETHPGHPTPPVI